MAHGAQKLLGAFGGKGLPGASAEFERMGLTPGRRMALLGGSTEIRRRRTDRARDRASDRRAHGRRRHGGGRQLRTAVTARSTRQRGFELPATNLALASRACCGRTRSSSPRAERVSTDDAAGDDRWHCGRVRSHLEDDARETRRRLDGRRKSRTTYATASRRSRPSRPRGSPSTPERHSSAQQCPRTGRIARITAPTRWVRAKTTHSRKRTHDDV